MLAIAACQDTGSSTDQCDNGKCEDLGLVGQLMPRAPESQGTIHLTRTESDWSFEVIGAKGEILLLSENYASRASALNGRLSVEDNGVYEDRYETIETNGGFSFVLKAQNGETIADGQTYASEPEAKEAIRAARDLVAGIVQYRAALTSEAQFQLARDNGAWLFDLRDKDGKQLLKSQRYSRRRDAITGVASIRENGKNAGRYEVLDSPPRFILKAANGKEIAESAQTYDTPLAAQEDADATRALLQSERVANPW